jgi:hypothetical protein
MSQVGFLANGRSARVLVQVFEMPMTRNIFSFFFSGLVCIMGSLGDLASFLVECIARIVGLPKGINP